jgi:hypothetical protein
MKHANHTLCNLDSASRRRLSLGWIIVEIQVPRDNRFSRQPQGRVPIEILSCHGITLGKTVTGLANIRPTTDH